MEGTVKHRIKVTVMAEQTVFITVECGPDEGDPADLTKEEQEKAIAIAQSTGAWSPYISQTEEEP